MEPNDIDIENSKLRENDAVSQKRLRHFLDIEYLSQPLLLDILDLPIDGPNGFMFFI